MVVEPSELVLCTDPDGLGAFRSPVIAELATARYPATYHPGLPKRMDWRNRTRTSIFIRPNAVEQSFAMFGEILDRPNAVRLITLADLLTRSVKALSELTFEVSLGLSWMVCEACLDQMWDRYLDRQTRKEIDGVLTQVINRERRDKLNGRDYSASVIAEILSLADVLPYRDYKELSQVRSARNDWIHDLETVEPAVARKASELAQRMLFQVEGVHFTVWPSLAV
jgi:hypothetical protein